MVQCESTTDGIVSLDLAVLSWRHKAVRLLLGFNDAMIRPVSHGLRVSCITL